MQLNVNQEDLMKGLNIVKTALAGKTTNPILKTIFLEARDGMLEIKGTDGVTYISYIFPCEIEREGGLCVDSLLINLIEKLNTENVNLTREKKSLIVSQGKRKHILSGLSTKQFPQKPVIKNYEVTDLSNLKYVFSMLYASVRVKEDREYLQGIHINPYLNYAISGDGDRVSLIKVDDLKIPGNISAPKGKILGSILRHFSGSVKSKFKSYFGQTNGFLFVDYDDKGSIKLQLEVIVQSVDGDFPEGVMDGVLSAKQKKEKLKITVDKNTLKSILELGVIYYNRALSDGSTVPIELERRGREVVLKMNVKGVVSMSEPLECESVGKDYHAAIDCAMLLDVLSVLKNDTVEIRFFKGTKPFIIVEDDYIYMQSLMEDM